MTELKLAIALMLVVEGLIYAIFPQGMQSMMARIIKMPASTLRYVGLACAIIGVGLVWLVRH